MRRFTVTPACYSFDLRYLITDGFIIAGVYSLINIVATSVPSHLMQTLVDYVFREIFAHIESRSRSYIRTPHTDASYSLYQSML